MTEVDFEGQSYALQDNESILDCLLRNGVDFPHSCKTGVCQSCMCQSDISQVDTGWQKGLKPTLAAKGYLLACTAKPEEDISVVLPSADESTTSATISELVQLNKEVYCIRFSVEDLEPWIPGQYLNLINPDGVIRSYSIANVPSIDGYIEIHVKFISGGLMGEWLVNHVKVGEQVNLRGPVGECYYCNPTNESFPMVLAGTGTGLAPLIGIAQDALKQNHSGDITLVHGGGCEQDLYCDKKLTALAEAHSNFHYQPCLQDNGQSIDAILLDVLKPLSNPRVYVCGSPEITKTLKTKAFLAGVASGNIYSDSFLRTS